MEMVLGRSLGLQKGINNIRQGKYLSKYKIFKFLEIIDGISLRIL